MKLLENKIAIITGAGRGLGRAHALYFAEQGAKVIVNDIKEVEGEHLADRVVREIVSKGGEAQSNYEDVSSFNGAQRIIEQAIETFGGLDILVNNAGILRDKMIFNMTEKEFDEVINVHLKGTFNCTRHACAYWRERFKKGDQRGGSIVNTTSEAGLQGNVGQSNYASAKSGIATMTIVVAREMKKYNVNCNCISPLARTELALSSPPVAEVMKLIPAKPNFDPLDPSNASPLVAFLASDKGRNITGKVFRIIGGKIDLYKTWEIESTIEKDGRWEPDELEHALAKLLEGKSHQEQMELKQGLEKILKP
ncbi:MAG: SDR family NAD(P)-dependent oxidoreductase [Candidatus Jordarchaeaceae archaeon]